MLMRLFCCRICKNNTITKFLQLGKLPLPNGFLGEKDLKKRETYYPLNAGYCTNCGLVQLLEIVDPEEMFRNYVYIPSASKTRMNNFASIAQNAKEKVELNSGSLVIDIGSNDGSLLSFFKGYGIKTLGIDPATNLAKIAELKGIETINNYISSSLARKISKTIGKAEIITATNVIAHIDNLHELFMAAEILLRDNGLFICEFPYLLDLLQNNQFDTIYHEHLSYFSIRPLMQLMNHVKLQIVDVVRTPIDGGSLRVFFSKKNEYHKPSLKLTKMLSEENESGLDDPRTYIQFTKNVKKLKKELKETLIRLKKKGKTIAAYGAAAKGNILLNYCGITDKIIDFAVDSTPYKQGLYMPGSHIRIFPEIEILKRKPDYTLVLAWNFAKEIMDKEKKYANDGGKFIIPVPHVTIV